jgi:GDP/UDP-N,N'-diacetylbacillosamine 2-epimerase (hydrolysing)
MSLMSTYHFTNTANNAKRVRQITGRSENVFHTGSLAVDNIKGTELYTSGEFKAAFNFDLNQPFVLFTFHPETIDYNMNKEYAQIIGDVLITLKKNVLVTMPNADTMGEVIREALYKASVKNNNIHLIESLGSRGYYTALAKCIFVLGNSSSGIIEAASFSKYAINLGNRQLGREAGDNVIHCRIDKEEILNTIRYVEKLPDFKSNYNIYGNGEAAKMIYSELKRITFHN